MNDPDPTRTAPAHPPISSSSDMQPRDTLLQRGAFDPPATPGTLGRLDRFEILRLLGEGGMGQVYLVREPRTDTQVAIKIMKPDAADDPREVHRFLTEARHMYRLAHPRILRVLEVSDRPAGPYYVMPFIAGGSLLARCKPGETLPETEVLAIARQVAEALAHAHSHGLIHRDLKPGNVLLDKDGNAYLTDFGLVRTLFNDSMVDASASHLEGTAPYMSPAVARGEAEDTRCDIYAFGALLYELLTGQPPYTGRTPQIILDQVLKGPPKPLRDVNPKASPALVKIAEGCMARELRDRYASMADVVADLEYAAKGKAPFGPHRQLGQRLPRLAALAAAAVVLVGVVWAATHLATIVRTPRVPASGVERPASLPLPELPPEPPETDAPPVLADDTLQEGMFAYTVTNGTATIVKYTGPGGDVAIPSGIKGLPVVSIGDSAFGGHTNVTGVTIPDTVTYIGFFAFQGCRGLTNAHIPHSVSAIRWAPFAGCTRLTSITVDSANTAYCSLDGVLLNKEKTYLINYPAGRAGDYEVPSSVGQLGCSSFMGCDKLTAITFPDYPNLLPNGSVFYGCSALASVTLPSRLARIGSYMFTDCTSLTNIVIPASVKTTGRACLRRCPNLTAVYFEGDAPLLDDGSFFAGSEKVIVYYRPGTKGWGKEFAGRPTKVWEEDELPAEAPPTPDLTGAKTEGQFLYTATADGQVVIAKYTGPGGDVTIPATIDRRAVVGIGYRSFQECTNLTGVTIPDSVTDLGVYAFQGRANLSRVSIPDSVTNIGLGAFSGCSGLTNFAIPRRVTEIADWTFADCTNLADVTIPFGVTKIGRMAFRGCTSLTNVTIPESVTVISGSSTFRDCTRLTNFRLPERITNIEAWTFAGCANLTNITVAGNVTNIGTVAFRDCPLLKSVYFNGDCPSLGENAFLNTLRATIYYRPGTKGWGAEFGGRPTAVWEGDAPAPVAASPLTGQYMVVDLSGGTRAARYPVSSLDDVPKGGWTDEFKTDKLVLRRIEPGTFVMGSPTNEVSRDPGRETQHPVTLTKPFYIGVFEVTQRQWERVMGTRPSYFDNPAHYAARPVQGVSHNMIRGAVESLKWPASNVVDADSFLGRLRNRTGLDFELPTDAQWEYACRAGTTTSFSNGKNLLSEEGPCPGLETIARYAHNSGSLDGTCMKESDASKGTAKVGSYAPNPWGLYDMHGNVYEWVVDWWSPITNSAAVTDPVGPERGGCKIVRGGAWTSTHCRSAVRPGSRNCHNASSTFGFRLAAPAVRPAQVTVGPAILPFTWTTNDNAITITKYTGLGGDVEVPEKIEGLPVTVIGRDAFRNNRTLTMLTLPDTVTNIGYYAFNSCTALTELHIPESVIRIDQWAFSGCTSLTNMTLLSRITNIERGTFANCLLLKDIIIPPSVTRIEWDAFSGCQGLRMMRIPRSVSLVCASAFAGCSGLTAFHVDPANTNFWSDADGVVFSKDKTTLVLRPAGKAGRYVIPDDVTKIGDAAFFGNALLEAVDIHARVTRIGIDAFSGCTNLTSMTIPEGVVEIGSRAFMGCSGITRLSVPASVIRLWPDTFAGVARLETIDIAPENAAYCSVDGVLFNKAKTVLLRYPQGKGGHYTVPKGITEIGGSAFTHSDLLTGVTIPGTVLRIGNNAFNGCDVLSSVRIEEGVTHIDDCAFRDCPQLKTVAVPASVAAMGPNPFWNCVNLTAITVDPANTVYASDAEGVVFDKERKVLINYPSGRAGHYAIPDGVVKLRDAAFAYANKLTSIVIPTSIERLEHAPLASAGALTHIIFTGDAPQLARPDVFAGPRSATIYYPPNAKGWGKAFGGRPTAAGEVKGPFLVADNRGTLTVIRYLGAGGEVVIPAMIEGVPVGTIGRDAFKNCASVTSLIIPGSVTTIDQSAFQGCTGLAGVSVAKGLQTIGHSAFRDCGRLMSIELPESLQTIGNDAFRSTAIGQIQLPASVRSVGANVFAECGAPSIAVDPGNEAFTSRDGVLFSKDGTVLMRYVSGPRDQYDVPEGVTSIADWALTDVTNLMVVNFPKSLTSIGAFSFHGCRNLQQVTIPSNVTTIGAYAFGHCYGITNVTLEGGITNLDTACFYHCDALPSVTIPASVTNIGDYVFRGCDSLLSIKVDTASQSFRASEDGVLFDKQGTALVMFPTGRSGAYAVPDGVTHIRNGAFRVADKLIEVVLPASVVSLGWRAFYACSSMKSVFFMGDAPEIQADAFSGCRDATIYYRPGTKGWGPTFGGRPTKVWEED